MNALPHSHCQNIPSAARWFKYARLVLLGILLYAIAACGGEETPTPTPEPVAATQPPMPETITPLSEETLPVSIDTPIQTAVMLATPTVSELTVDEDDGKCTVDYDIDLAGYPDLNLTMGCAIGGSSNEAVAINEFGVGPDYSRFMLWFSAEQQIYVLFPDQTWQSYRDTWDESQPEYSCNPSNVAPSSPPLPRRGFGKLWCTVEGLQQQMGTTDREERLCQHSVVQIFEQGRLLACFEDATIRYFRLLNDGTWDLLTVR